MSKKQSATCRALFGTASFLPALKQLSRMKGKGIEVLNIIKFLEFLTDAQDIDVVNFIKSGRIEETRQKLELITGKASLLEFNAALQSLYVPMRQIGGGASLAVDIEGEMKAIKQKLEVKRPDGLSAAAAREGRFKHPDVPVDQGTRELRAVR